MNYSCDTTSGTSRLCDLCSMEEDASAVLVESSLRITRPTLTIRPTITSADSTTQGVLPACFYEAIVRFATFRELQPNWDSYGAELISEKAIATALELLSRLQRYHCDSARRLGEEGEGLNPEALKPVAVVPVGHGGVQLEWSSASGEIEVEIGPDGVLDVLSTSGSKGTPEFVEWHRISIEWATDLVAEVLMS